MSAPAKALNVFTLSHDGAKVIDLSAYRQRRDDQRSLWLALDHLDAAGLCSCWVGGRQHRGRQVIAPTGTGGPA
jgi:hypothetical protein